jgi:hypothetical protein
MMVSFRFLLAILICLFYAQVNAEDASNNSLEPFLSEKRALIKENIKFTEQEQNAFWPLYDNYMNELAKRYHRRTALVKIILKEKGAISENQAGIVIDEHFELVSERLKSKKEMLTQLRKRKIPETKILKFFQIEENMQASFFYLLAAHMSLTK